MNCRIRKKLSKMLFLRCFLKYSSSSAFVDRQKRLELVFLQIFKDFYLSKKLEPAVKTVKNTKTKCQCQIYREIRLNRLSCDFKEKTSVRVYLFNKL